MCANKTDWTWWNASHLNLNHGCINRLKVWIHFSKVNETPVTCNICERLLTCLMLKSLSTIHPVKVRTSVIFDNLDKSSASPYQWC